MSISVREAYAELINEVLALVPHGSLDELDPSLHDTYYYSAALAGDLDAYYDPDSRHEARLQRLIWDEEFDRAVHVAQQRQEMLAIAERRALLY